MSTVSFKVGSANDFNSALNELNNQLASIRKDVTYLDVYNIVDTVVSQENLQAQINALTPNSSLVINRAPFQSNGVNYSRGDIVLKNVHGEVIHVPGSTGGLYYPKQVTADKEGNYTIQYQFTPRDPIIGASTTASSLISGVWNVDSVTEYIDFPLTTATTATTNRIYGQEKLISQDGLKINNFNKSIPPMIEFYFCEVSDKLYTPVEKIDLEYFIKLSSDGGATISIPKELNDNNIPILVRVK